MPYYLSVRAQTSPPSRNTALRLHAMQICWTKRCCTACSPTKHSPGREAVCVPGVFVHDENIVVFKTTCSPTRASRCSARRVTRGRTKNCVCVVMDRNHSVRRGRNHSVRRGARFCGSGAARGFEPRWHRVRALPEPVNVGRHQHGVGCGLHVARLRNGRGWRGRRLVEIRQREQRAAQLAQGHHNKRQRVKHARFV